MVIFQGREYAKIKKFDCCVIDLEHEHGGGVFTALPISSLEHRTKPGHRDFPDNVIVNDTGLFTIFKITDDWGTMHIVMISSKDHQAEIQSAIEAAKEQGLIPTTLQKEPPCPS